MRKLILAALCAAFIGNTAALAQNVQTTETVMTADWYNKMCGNDRCVGGFAYISGPDNSGFQLSRITYFGDDRNEPYTIPGRVLFAYFSQSLRATVTIITTDDVRWPSTAAQWAMQYVPRRH